MSQKRTLALLITVTALFGFQNCSAPKSGTSSEQSSTTPPNNSSAQLMQETAKASDALTQVSLSNPTGLQDILTQIEQILSEVQALDLTGQADSVLQARQDLITKLDNVIGFIQTELSASNAPCDGAFTYTIGNSGSGIPVIFSQTGGDGTVSITCNGGLFQFHPLLPEVHVIAGFLGLNADNTDPNTTCSGAVSLTLDGVTLNGVCSNSSGILYPVSAHHQ